MRFLDQFHAFHDQAAALCGTSDFGPDDYVEPLKLALTDYDRCTLNDLGRQMIAGGVVGQLAARLVAQEGMKRHPDFARAPIEKPIIITGMMRTGSTALHRLLAADPGTQWLAPWLGATPMPRPPRATWASQPGYQAVAGAFEQMYTLAPAIRQIHPMHADEPDECRFAMDQTFWSSGTACTAHVPNYAEWALTGDVRAAYRRYRALLGLIAGGDPRRWVLKDPSHLWRYDDLLTVFPDACIVYTHREPVEATVSLSSLIWELRRLREPALTRTMHGREELALWSRAQEHAEAARDRHDPARFLDIHLRELRADPAGTAERIYRHFGIAVTEAAREAWKTHATRGESTGRNPERLRPEDFGFTAEDVERAHPRYLARYRKLYGP